MIPQAVYALCALTSAFCAALLTRAYRRSRDRLLLWSAWCFALLTVANVLLVVDLAILPSSVDLSLLRSGVSLIAVTLLAIGLVWESR